MLRRDFVRGGLAFGVSAAAILPIASAQTPDDAANLDYNSILDEVSSELEALASERLETIGGAEFTAKFRSVLDQKAMKADFPVPPLTPDLLKKLAERKYWKLPENDRPPHAWPAFHRSPDYAHLAAIPLANRAFTLSSDLLRVLAERNAFDLSRTTRPVVLFGLRGCRIASGAASSVWSEEHALEVVDPHHVKSSCVIGIWRRSDGMLAVYRASTVPAVAHMYMSLAEGGAGASLLPTGLYAYRAGTHLASKPRSIQRGALRISGPYVVLRTARDLSYDPHADTTAWTRGEAHNLHAGGGADLFSCAGCQVVPGGYSGPERRTATGEWSRFQTMAGLVDKEGKFLAEEQSPSFLYMLLTGHEAALAFHGGAAFENGYYRLRPGSSGPDVLALQKDLLKQYPNAVGGFAADSEFGMRTSFAVLIDRQKQAGQYTSPVVAI